MLRLPTHLRLQPVLCSSRAVSDMPAGARMQEGVRIAAVEAALRGTKVERSDSCLLVKTLPATVDEGLIRDKFSRFGALRRVVLPPLKLLALVEFFDANDAKYALFMLPFIFCVAFARATEVQPAPQESVQGAGVHEV